MKRKSFRDMTPRQRGNARKKMLAIPVTNEEITQWDPMVFKVMRDVILQYWGRQHVRWNPNDGSNEAIIGRLGLSVSDLMQYGRMFVCNQIRWYKLYGDPNGSKLGSLIFQYLNYKFQNMSRIASNKKHGGFLINVYSERKILQKFLDDFDDTKTIRENRRRLKKAIEPISVYFQKDLNKTYKSNSAMKKFLYDTIINMNLVSFQSYDEIEPYTVMNKSMNPEEFLIAKETISKRANTLPPIKKRQAFGKELVFMSLASKKGIRSRLKLAKKLGTSLPTLNKISSFKRIGPKTYLKVSTAMEKFFKKPMSDLMRVDEPWR